MVVGLRYLPANFLEVSVPLTWTLGIAADRMYLSFSSEFSPPRQLATRWWDLCSFGRRPPPLSCSRYLALEKLGDRRVPQLPQSIRILLEACGA